MKASSCTFLGALLGGLVGVAACVDGSDRAVSTESSTITGGQNDNNDPEANVVVWLVSPNVACTGTLITPQVVLTAKHCVTGSTSDYGGLAAAGSAYTIYIGNYLPNVTSNSRVQVGPARLYGNNSDPVNANEKGADVAILFLDRPIYDVHIVRPSLVAPHASGDDANGGDYPVPIAISGWSMIGPHDLNYRQLAFINDVHHYPDYPGAGDGTPSGQDWEHDETNAWTDSGDSGGPLMTIHEDGVREVLGVASGKSDPDIGATTDYWTDVTRGAPRDFVISNLREGRTSAWLARHERVDYWTGENDYWGSCRRTQDVDCDHWLDVHDNCAVTPNPDQRDTDDDGHGDACTPLRTAWNNWGWLDGAMTSVSVARTANGPLMIFARGTDGYLYTRWQTYSWPTWAGWQRIGNLQVTGRAAAALDADGRLEVFIRGSDNAMWHIAQTVPGGSGTWATWKSLGGYLTSDPAVGINGDGRLEVFARGGDGALYNRWQNAPNVDAWGGWSSMGNYIQGNPSVAANTDGSLDVFVRGGDNVLWHKRQIFGQQPWSDWQYLGGTLAGDPVVARDGDGRLEVFVVAGDGKLWNRWQLAPSWNNWGGWGDMQWTGAALTSAPAVVTSNAGTEVFIRGPEGALWRRARQYGSSPWGAWSTFGGYMKGPAAASINNDGRLEVFMIGSENGVWSHWQP